jgi:hypothetical protein
MSNYDMAKTVLERAQEEIIRELALCGQNGGVGRAQNYAPILVTLNKAIEVVESFKKKDPKEFVERMAKAKASKAAKAE